MVRRRLASIVVRGRSGGRTGRDRAGRDRGFPGDHLSQLASMAESVNEEETPTNQLNINPKQPTNNLRILPILFPSTIQPFRPVLLGLGFDGFPIPHEYCGYV